MSSIVELAGTWGLPRASLVKVADGPRVTAVRWQHALPELPDAVLPHNTLTYLYKGSRAFRHCGGRVQAAPGAREAMGLVPGGSAGAWTFDGPVDVLHIYVPQDFLNELTTSVGRPAVELCDRLFLDDPLLRAMAREIASTMGEELPDLLYADTLGSALAMRLVREYASELHPIRIAKGGLAPWQVRYVAEYLDSHLGDEVRLSTLAALVGLSPNHFCTAFKRSTGEPPHRALTRMRIERAKQMLTDRNVSVTELALHLGFGSSAHFTTVFRKYTGTSPSTWRRDRSPAAFTEDT